MSGSSDDRFREMFYEEARELLIGLEEGLMDLERRQSDRAHLDKTFRAAHSFKGAAAMVGLGAIAEFTHGIEAVLDRIRAGSLAVDSDIITTLLEARDHLAAMVEAEAARSPIPPSGELTQRLDLAVARARSPDAPAEPDAGAGPPAAARRRHRPSSPPRPSRPRLRRPAPPEPKSPSAQEPRSEGPKPRRSRAHRGRRREDGPAAGRHRRRLRTSETGTDGEPDLTIYRITLTPGPDILRRGINPAGRPRRAARAGRDVDRHRPGPGPAARPARPGAVLPELDDHGQDRRATRSDSAKCSCSSPKTARSRSSGWAPMASGCRSGSAKPAAAGAAAAADRGRSGRRRRRPRSGREPAASEAVAAPAAANGSTPAHRRAPRRPRPRRSLAAGAGDGRRRRCRGCTPGSGSTPRSSTTWSAWPASWPCCPTT